MVSYMPINSDPRETGYMLSQWSTPIEADHCHLLFMGNNKLHAYKLRSQWSAPATHLSTAIVTLSQRKVGRFVPVILGKRSVTYLWIAPPMVNSSYLLQGHCNIITVQMGHLHWRLMGNSKIQANKLPSQWSNPATHHCPGYSNVVTVQSGQFHCSDPSETFVTCM